MGTTIASTEFCKRKTIIGATNVRQGLQLTAIILLFLCGNVWAEIISGRTLSVADGDTITIVDSEKARHRIRLGAIDAPERGQPFSKRSRQNLARMVAGKLVAADCHKIDRYGRRVCKVLVAPPECPTCDKSFDVGLAQIGAGLAWHYKQFESEQSVADRTHYAAQEKQARAHRKGLWEEANPVAPWEWRRRAR